ncbi:hypothetical protein GA0070620_0077 [Micromonospora krabiensis]|uniref:Uncharacterized protein n=2 Tax=Micromonospora krabiensis TaxID=307121 RepID=A0A1C3MWE9_9ACTN|nr:hypothetical protein GA0070620_0077 [Micromonospora krabiensis]
MAWEELVRPSGAPRGFAHVELIPRTDARTNLLIAEYNAIHALVAQKAAASHALVGAYMTVVAVLLGLVVANGADPRLLLALPVLSAVSGVTILRRRRDREAANRYVLEVLKPAAAECAGDERMFTWGEHYARHKAGRSLLYELGLQLVFPLSGLACLIVTFPRLESVTDWSIWVAGSVLLVVLLLVYVGQNRSRLVARVAVGFRSGALDVVLRRRARRVGSGDAER